MKRDYPDRPVVGIGAVIVEGTRVVVVRRNREPLKGQWSLPGGVLELGETLREGTAREVLEETGLVVEVVEVLDVFDRIVRDPHGRTQFHYVLIDFLCRAKGGDLRAGSDVSEVRWLEQFPLTEGAGQVIRKALRSAAGA
jgi:ADP-ribose pyrophosphatase YjhB (NUDIX family)